MSHDLYRPQLDKSFVLKVQPSINLDCSWESYLPSDNCYFLVEAINAVINIGFLPTIFSTARIWEQFFGSSCDIPGVFPFATLWYANYDNTGQVTSTRSLDDFVPFGGWIADSGVVMKQVKGNVTVPLTCIPTVTDWHAFVD